jgi:hypothetical protein
MDGQLVLQLRDPLPRRHQLRLISAGQPRYLTAVDQLLTAPGIARLSADLQIVRDLRNRPPRGNQVQDSPAELGRVTPRHNILHGLLDGRSSSNPTPENPGNIINCRALSRAMTWWRICFS